MSLLLNTDADVRKRIELLRADLAADRVDQFTRGMAAGWIVAMVSYTQVSPELYAEFRAVEKAMLKREAELIYSL